MKTLVKIPRKLLFTALDDLERRHPFAGERLGFFSFRQSIHAQTPILLCHEYHSIPDEQYVVDWTCGGRINGEAIRAAMGRAYREQSGQLWVHTHGRQGDPMGSHQDLLDGPKVAQSVLNAQPKALQGWAVISEEGIFGEARGADDSVLPLTDLTVVGWPMSSSRWRKRESTFKRILKGFSTKRTDNSRYDRQSFLGPNSQAVIENAKVGIVGLGGGGSHISQQLAHLGFRRIVLCDADRIEATNLNRVVGATLQDVRKKRHKTEICGRLFQKLQPKAQIDAAPEKWECKLDALRDCDLIFGCVDSFMIRRDLEAFCRSLMIPLIDIGMKVLRAEGAPPEICGQTILSMPGELCMHCHQFLTPENLAREAEDYNAGPQPQVVWPNGVLASNAVGYAMGLLTGWSGSKPPSWRVDYKGSQMLLTGSHLVEALQNSTCRHYPLSRTGDAIFRKL